MKMLLNILMLLALFVLAGMLMLFLFQNSLLYPAPKFKPDLRLPDHVTEVDFKLSEGFLLLPKLNNDSPVPLMIFTHGNGELASYWLNEFDPLLDGGIAVLIMEYPGYASSKEKPSLATINQTMLEAFDFAANQAMIDETKIFAYGRSIGGGAAALLAERRPLAALCFESTFSSLPQLVSEKGLPSFLLRDRYNNEAIIKQLDIPIFIYHGTEDEIIPYSHAESLNEAGNNVTLITERCGHNNCPRKWRELIAFLQQNGAI